MASLALAATNSTATMLPEPPPLDFGSPRVRAAMRVLGIVPGDLEQKALDAFDGSEKRHELFVRKRRHLVEQVAAMAERGPEACGPGSEAEADASAAYLEGVLHKEQEGLDRLQAQTRKDVHKVIIQELAAKLHTHRSLRRQEEAAERAQRLRGEQAERRKLLSRAAARKAEKASEAREKCSRSQQERGDGIMQKIQEASDKAAQRLAGLSQAHGEAGLKKHERRAQFDERRGLQELEFLRERERRHDAAARAGREEQGGLLSGSHAESRQRADPTRTKQQGSVDRIQVAQGRREAETEDLHSKSVERHADTQARRKNLTAERLKVSKVRNAKAKTAHEARYERILNEQQSSPQISRRLSQSASEPTLLRSCTRDIDAFSGHRSNHTELVSTNRDRLGRAQHHASEQQIGRLAAMRARAQGIHDAREQAGQRRMDMLRKCAIEKSRLTRQLEKLRDAPPGKMLRMLSDLNPDPESAAKINYYLVELGLGPLGGEAADDAEKA